ncbi:MAG: hypothetical protein QM737_18515 [Ferruginibacter sp.]
MPKGLIIKYLIIGGIFIFYLIFTIRYFIIFRKNILFAGKNKTFHLIMIWFIPFIWILLLKSLIKSTPGSHEVKDLNTPGPFSDNNNDASTASNMGF